MSPIKIFSVKLFDPTTMVPVELLDELLDELPPEDGDRPQALNMTTSAAIITNVKASFFVIFLFSFCPGLTF